MQGSRQQVKQSQNAAIPTAHKSTPQPPPEPAKASSAAEPDYSTRDARKQSVGTTNYREEAERIVAEEKAQGERMPSYDGLEDYTLIEKMGDGAFSNVYKAVEKKTGRKVAVKVVRKYELNHSQVSARPANASLGGVCRTVSHPPRVVQPCSGVVARTRTDQK